MASGDPVRQRGGGEEGAQIVSGALWGGDGICVLVIVNSEAGGGGGGGGHRDYSIWWRWR